MKNGPYTLIIAPTEYPGKKYRDRYAYEHIVTWWEYHKQLPTKNISVVHHINGNKTDNRIENLQLVTTAEHAEEHTNIAFGVVICSQCLSPKIRALNNFRKQIKDGRKQYCSKQCQYVSLKKKSK